jgi:hypothetical protein
MTKNKKTLKLYVKYKTNKTKHTKYNKNKYKYKQMKGGNNLFKYLRAKQQEKAIEFIKEHKYDIFKYDELDRDPLFYAEKYHLNDVIKEINTIKQEIEDNNYVDKLNKIKYQSNKPYNTPITKAVTNTPITKAVTNTPITKAVTNTGYDPYLNDYIEIDKWLKEDTDNIMIEFNLKQICLKKKYFIDVIIDNLILKCIFKNNILIVKQMINTIDYINLKRYGFESNVIINKNNLLDILTNLQTQTIKLITTNEIMNGINKTFILNNPASYNEYVTNNGISYLVQNSLAFYTSKWDEAINSYLRIGESYFNSTEFKNDSHFFGEKIEQSIINIKHKIALIDTAFYDAPKTQSNIILYRGIKQSLSQPIYDGIQLSYLSTTPDINIASGFTSYDDNCCIYKLILDIGIPYIYLDYISQTSSEKEYLLPRGLILVYKNKYIQNDETVYECFVKLDDNTRYQETSICSKYEILDIHI